jgi:intracellular sulfur oxidation DsrE/DsrF family protein
MPLILSLALSTTAAAVVQAAPLEDHRPVGAWGYAQPGSIRLVIDLNTASTGDAEANPGLLALDELVTRYEARRLHPPKVDIMVVLHGKTAILALEDHAVRRVGDTVSTHDRTLMKALAAKGVRFVVSLKSLASPGARDDEIMTWIARGPDASMIFLDLEASGYVFDTAKSLGRD